MALIFRERRHGHADPRLTFKDFRKDLHGEVLELCDRWSERSGVAVEINHGVDGRHMDGSLHYQGLALDLDTEGDRAEDLSDLYAFLAARLSSSWQVIAERSHVHVEFDPR